MVAKIKKQPSLQELYDQLAGARENFRAVRTKPKGAKLPDDEHLINYFSAEIGRLLTQIAEVKKQIQEQNELSLASNN